MCCDMVVLRFPDFLHDSQVVPSMSPAAHKMKAALPFFPYPRDHAVSFLLHPIGYKQVISPLRFKELGERHHVKVILEKMVEDGNILIAIFTLTHTRLATLYIFTVILESKSSCHFNSVI